MMYILFSIVGLLVLVLAAFWLFNKGHEKGREAGVKCEKSYWQSQIKFFQREAVRQKAAKWVVDINGEVTFQWNNS